jgi:Ca2+-binding EF-hand superfamily protein
MPDDKEHQDNITITSNEIKELKRVFHKLCFFSEKAPKIERMKDINSKLMDLKRIGNGYSSNIDAKDDVNEARKLEEELNKLKLDLKGIESRTEKYIRPKDVGYAMKSLGKRMTKREIQDLIWEVDEKVDGIIDWQEFSLMFERNVKDTSGLEPSGFYIMVQFMIYDRDDNGKVSIDETMNMLYGRVGRQRMEESISKLFGGEDGSPIVEVGYQGGEIDFEHFWSVSEVEQRKLFDSSELGRNMAEKKGAKKSPAKD